MKGFIIAAPHSGAGKTMVTLGLLRAFRNRGVRVVSAKSGPDYIDPQFHAAASGQECVNLDAWAMPAPQIQGLAAEQSGDLLIVEGAMGLFDGAPDTTNPMGTGSVADLAEILDLPVILVLDAAKQSQTAAAVVHGLATLRPSIKIAGVILNRLGSARHGTGIARAITSIGVPVLGQVPRSVEMCTPSRHLGLVQAIENPDLDAFIDKAAELVSTHVDLAGLTATATPISRVVQTAGLPPLAQRVAVAKDAAFAFSYPHILDAWRRDGAEVSFFSPLNDEGPVKGAGAVFLPGGYPELFAGQLAANTNFKDGMKNAATSGTLIYGECGGYMTLGETLTDKDGYAHRMLGLLPVHTSFANPKLHLGYRHLEPLAGLPWAESLRGHEFHYASVTSGEGPPLFAARDSLNNELKNMGHANRRVCGSFAHVIGG